MRVKVAKMWYVDNISGVKDLEHLTVILLISQPLSDSCSRECGFPVTEDYSVYWFLLTLGQTNKPWRESLQGVSGISSGEFWMNILRDNRIWSYTYPFSEFKSCQLRRLWGWGMMVHRGYLIYLRVADGSSTWKPWPYSFNELPCLSTSIYFLLVLLLWGAGYIVCVVELYWWKIQSGGP